MLAGVPEAKAAEESSQFLLRLLVHREFKEFKAVKGRRLRQALAIARLRLRQDKRAQSVACGLSCRGRAEIIVEDLQRERSTVPARQDGAQEIVDRQLSLSREISEMPAP